MTIPKAKRKRVRVERVKVHREHVLQATLVGDWGATIQQMKKELRDMNEVLKGNVEPPPEARNGLLTLMEVADAYFSRAMEMMMQLQEEERLGNIAKGSSAYRFRTGMLRTFIEMVKKKVDLGSRRISYAALQVEAERTGRQNFMGVFTDDEEDDER